MRTPDAPLALLVALAPTIALVALALWRARSKSLTGFHAAFLAVGLALAALVVAVSSTYAFAFFRPLQTSNLLVIAPAVAYVATLAIVGARAKLNYGTVGLWAIAGLVPLWFIGFYAWLLAACSFGDCL